MKKILFLHGFFATGSCPMARALKEAFEGTAVVLTPDLPLHPKKALNEIRSIIDKGLQSWKPCSSTIATHIIRIVCGDFLVSRTPWLTSPLSSWSITIKPSISLAVIRLLSRR